MNKVKEAIDKLIETMKRAVEVGLTKPTEETKRLLDRSEHASIAWKLTKTKFGKTNERVDTFTISAIEEANKAVEREISNAILNKVTHEEVQN